MTTTTIVVANKDTGARTAFPYTNEDTVGSVAAELLTGNFLGLSPTGHTATLQPSNRSVRSEERVADLNIGPETTLEFSTAASGSAAAGHYKAEINREQPTCILFIVDQSGSMNEELEAGLTKAQFVADALNRSLTELIVTCRKQEGVLHYFDIGVIGYGASVGSSFGGKLANTQICSITALAESPIRVETRKRKVSDGAGGVIETEFKFPVWFNASASGGTPMCAALRMAGTIVAEWCAKHSSSFPPTVLHITDGEATDGTPEAVAAAASTISGQGTRDGKVILMNLHVEPVGGAPIRFPANERILPAGHAQVLFQISSPLPTEFLRRATAADVRVEANSRGYVYNGRLDDISKFFEIGTRPRTGPAPIDR